MTERERAHADLKAARAQIEDPARWTQGTAARAPEGAAVAPDHPRACKWCASGALWLQVGPDAGRHKVALDLLVKAANEAPGIEPAGIGEAMVYPSCVNDALGHAATLAMYDRAIGLAARPEAALPKRGDEPPEGWPLEPAPAGW